MGQNVSEMPTPALRALTDAGVPFTPHNYTIGVDADTYGESVALALGVEPDRLFKTLVVEVDGRPVVAVVPVDGRLSLKELARAAGGKRAEMASPPVAERITGYVVGGISPFGQRKRLPAYCDASLLEHETVFVSGGRRGIQIELAPADLIELLDASTAPLAVRGH